MSYFEETTKSFRDRFEGYAAAHLKHMTVEEQEALYLRFTQPRPALPNVEAASAESGVDVIEVNAQTNGQILGKVAVSS